jgi:hypothetical protein
MSRRRNGIDDYVRDLERRIRAGDLSLVLELASLYTRLGRGEELRAITIDYHDGPQQGRATVVVPPGHPLARAAYWRAEPDPHTRERMIVSALREAGFPSVLEFPGYAHVYFQDADLTLAIGYANVTVGADLNDSVGHNVAGWAKEEGSAEPDTDWAVRIAREASARIASGELRSPVPTDGPAPPPPPDPADRRPIVVQALEELDDIGIPATNWRMGGNVHAAGIDPRVLPPGIHMFVAEDASGQAEAAVVVGWDAPATREQAHAILDAASHGDVIEEGGDDTLVMTGALWRVARVAASAVFAHNEFTCGCRHSVRSHESLVGQCSQCPCQFVLQATPRL